MTRAKYRFLTVRVRVAPGSDMGARAGALPPARPPVRGGTRRLLRHGRSQVRTDEPLRGRGAESYVRKKA